MGNIDVSQIKNFFPYDLTGIISETIIAVTAGKKLIINIIHEAGFAFSNKTEIQ